MRSGRFQELDGLRGIAAIAVVLYHFGYHYGSFYPQDGDTLWDGWWGEYGVQLFFLISGFVILMSAQRALRPSDFVISRAARLYPAYWIAVTVSIIVSVALVVPNTQIPWLDRIMNYTMLQRQMMLANVDQVYWTLGVELQFYILIFMVLVLTRSRFTDRFAAVLAGVWIGVSLLLAMIAHPYTSGVNPQFYPIEWKILVNLSLVEYGPLFSAGMLVYLARANRRYRPWAVASLGAPVLVTGILRGWDIALPVLVVVVIFGLVALRERTGFLHWRPIQFYGRISYSLYIAHSVVGIALIHQMVPYLGRNLSAVVAFALVTLLAMGYHRIGEVWGTKKLRSALLSGREWIDSLRGKVIA